MTRDVVLTVRSENDGESLESFLRKNGFSRRLIIKLKSSGGITRGGEIIRTVDKVRVNDEIRVRIEDSGATLPNPDVKAKIAFENEDIVVFDKPPNLAVHPSIVHYGDTLGNLFAALYPESTFRPIHRLDKDTSGLCACAKNQLAACALRGTIHKTYFAVVSGEITQSGEIDAPIGRAEDSIIKRMVRPDGQSALTLYKPLLQANGRTLLEITLKTGRTHQIRVHFSYIGHPLCGDDFYGGDRSEIKRQALHCGKMKLKLPVSEENITIESPLPQDIARLINR